MRQKFPAIFCQKRDENEPKKEKKREKKGAKAKIFFFFSRGNNLHTKFCQTRARFPRLDDFGARTHAQKLLLRTSNSFERKGTRRDRVFFSRAFWSHLSLSDQARTRRFLESAPSFLSLSRERKEARRTPKHNTVLAFPIRAKRQRKRTQRRETRRKPTHIAASFARDERNVARFSSRRAFSLSPYRSRELERRVSSFRWALEGGRESESPLKKRRQKKEAKKSV